MIDFSSSPLLKIILIILAVALIYWRVSRRWKRASDYSDRMAEEHEKEKAWFELAKIDPRFSALKQELDTRYKVSFDPPTDPESYRIDYISFYNASMQAVSPSDPAAKYVSVYMRGKEKLIISRDPEGGELHERRVNSFTYDAALPLWTKL